VKEGIGDELRMLDKIGGMRRWAPASFCRQLHLLLRAPLSSCRTLPGSKE